MKCWRFEGIPERTCLPWMNGKGHKKTPENTAADYLDQAGPSLSFEVGIVGSNQALRPGHMGRNSFPSPLQMQSPPAQN